MAFIDALRRALGGESSPRFTPREVEAAFLNVDPDTLPIADETPFESGVYDRAQWAKKLKRILAELPDSKSEWDDLTTEARAMGFDPAWVEQCSVEEFTLMVRRAVADRVVTDAEHRTIDLARDLIGLPDAKAEAILHGVVAEAEKFFGGTVEGA